MTTQDQQSRAEFDVWWREYGLGSYDTQLEAWQAARALPAGVKPAFTRRHEDICGDEVGPPEFGYSAAQVQAMGRVPPGFVVVPVEPTGDMLVAIMSEGEVDVLCETPERHKVLLIDRAGIPERYAALLAAAPRPPAAQKRYRLLERGIDTIQADDEFLRDADSTWRIDPQGIFVGMPYMSNVLLPARRAIETAP